MKTYKTTVAMVVFGLALMIIPKVTWAADISVGFFMGLPVPVVTVDAPRVHHLPPPVVIAPAPVYHGWHGYGHDRWHHKKFRHDRWARHGNWGNDCRDYGWGRGNGRDDQDRGWQNRDNDDRRWGRR